jgi:hypothetical protein
MRKSWPMSIEMPNLLEFQRQLRQAVLGGDITALAAAVCCDGLDPATRLQIYSNHAFATIGAVLEGTFPVVCRLVDKRFFAYAAHEYLREHPPHSRCLFEYGAGFADFLAGFEPCKDLPYLPRRALRMGPQHRRDGAGGVSAENRSFRRNSARTRSFAQDLSTALGQLFRLGLADRCDLAGEPAARGPDGESCERRHHDRDSPRG